MLPPRTKLDPKGYYARLGLEPVATRASIVTAFRVRARVLHPDVPATGNAEAFVALKQAYDVLANRARREEYDRTAQELADASIRDAPIWDAPIRDAPIRDAPIRGHSIHDSYVYPDDEIEDDEIEPEEIVVRPYVYRPQESLPRMPRLSRFTIIVLAGLGAALCLSVYQAASHLLAPSRSVNAGIRPNAATVEPLSPSAHRAVLYGPAPIRLAGTPNFYVVPAGSPAVLWRHDAQRNTLVPAGQLPPFSSVQAVRLIRQTGMLEVLVNDQGNGFVSADHLVPGGEATARSAYCGYNAGPTPSGGELLERRGAGRGTLRLENRAVQPAVVKLRDAAGTVAVAVFLGPGGHADLQGLPEGLYRPEFAIGELWSRACNLFAAGMRAQRMETEIRLPGNVRIVVAADAAEPQAADISDQAFERD